MIKIAPLNAVYPEFSEKGRNGHLIFHGVHLTKDESSNNECFRRMRVAKVNNECFNLTKDKVNNECNTSIHF